MRITGSASELTKPPTSFCVIMAFTSVSAECTGWWNTYSFLKCPPINLLLRPDVLTMRPVQTICSKILNRKLPISYGPVTLPFSKPEGNGTICVLWWISFPGKSLPGMFLPMLIQNWLSLHFEELTKNGRPLTALCFTPTGEPSIPPSHSGSFWILWMLCSLFQRKAIRLTMPAVNAFSNIWRKKKQTANVTVPCRSCSFLYLST